MIAKAIFAALALLLCACGVTDLGWQVIGHNDGPVNVEVGTLVSDDTDLLGFSWRGTSLVAPSLDGDLREPGVVIHEALQQVVLISYGLPPEADETWFSVSGDTQPVGEPISLEEAAWLNRVIASYPKITEFRLHPEPWVAEVVADACDRIDVALGWPAFVIQSD